MRWYRSQCDGDWEHSYGVSVETLDNPGWLLKIDLIDTDLQHVPFESVRIGNFDEEAYPSPDLSCWMYCKIENGKFEGAGGPSDLESLIGVFVDWAESIS